MVRLTFFYFLGFYLFSIQVLAQKQVESLEKLSEQINTEAEEILPLLSPSGDSLFFARVFHESNKGGKYSGSDIWLSLYDNETQGWAKPTNDLLNWNDKRNNFIIGVNPNEKIIYQNNPKDPDKGIRFVKNIKNNWTKPENLSLPGIPKSGYQGMYISPDYSVILISMKSPGNYGKEDLYVSTKNNKGNWTEPLNLGTTINTSESEISPFLSEDKKTLFFASKGHGGYGDMDIFMAERLYNSWTVWSKPQNLGEPINSKAFDGYYSEYGDSIAFFSSNRDGELSDVYRVNLNITSDQIENKRIISTSTAQVKSNRNYIDDKILNSEFGIPLSFTFELSLQKSEQENKLFKEQIWFLAGKLNRYPQLKVAFQILPLGNIPSEILVIQSNQIISDIFSNIASMGVETSKLAYDGIELDAKLIKENEQKVRIIPTFFK